MPTTVNGVVAAGKGDPVAVVPIVIPDPGPGEVVVDVRACGVCHTDLHYREGAINDDFPFLLGHEAAGVVSAVGDGVTDVSTGDYVVLAWRAPCGNCRSCRRGRPWYCFDSANAAQPMTLADGTPLSPALGHRRLRRKDAGRRRPGGQGRPGRPAGGGRAHRLWGHGRLRRGRQHRRRVVRRHGGRHRLRRRRRRRHRRLGGRRGPDGHRRRRRRPQARMGPPVRRHPHRQRRRTDPVEAIRGLTGGNGADVVIEAVGRPETYQQAFFARDLAGTLVQVGVPDPSMTIELPMIELFGRGGALKSSWYGDCLPTRDFPILIDLYLRGRLDLDGFVSETIGLGDVEEAFARMQRGDVLRSVVVLGT